MRKLAMCFGSLAEIATLNTTLRSTWRLARRSGSSYCRCGAKQPCEFVLRSSSLCRCRTLTKSFQPALNFIVGSSLSIWS